MNKNVQSKKDISPTTVRRFLVITFIVEGSIPQEASSIFSIFTQRLLKEFKARAFILSRQKTEETKQILAGLWCENASKHTFTKKIREAFSGYNLSKIESKKGMGAWSFALLSEDKEKILCFGEDISYLKGAAGAFQQHRTVSTVLKSKKENASARKTPKKHETSLPLDKKGAPHLVVRLLKGAYVFLFSYSPRLWKRRLLSFLAYFWGVLLLALLFFLVFFLLDYALEGLELNLEISPERAKRFNDFLEKYLRLPRIFKEPAPLPPAPWYHPRVMYSYGKSAFMRSLDWFCQDCLKEGLKCVKREILDAFWKRH